MPDKDVTKEVEIIPTRDGIEIHCICGAYLHIYDKKEADNWGQCFKCGRKLYFRQTITVWEVQDEKVSQETSNS